MGDETLTGRKVSILAKDKKKGGRSKASKGSGEDGSPRADDPLPAKAGVSRALKSAKARTAELASNPFVTEIVAAALVSAAAALRDPKKARAMAASVGDELEAASRQAKSGSGAFWQLALEVARRSVEAVGSPTQPKRDHSRASQEDEGRKKQKKKKKKKKSADANGGPEGGARDSNQSDPGTGG